MGAKSKGFITVATGAYYCKLAIHLYISYKLFGNCDFPFCVITNEEGEKLLGRIFDIVIVKKKLQYNWSDKLTFFTDTPFEETIFLDADCSIVRDISHVFNIFEKNGSDISAIAYIRQLESGVHGIQFSLEAVRKYNLMYDFPKFNGGVYYFRKNERAVQYLQFMFNDILPNYHSLGLLSGKHNEIYDEPIIILAMLSFGMNPISPDNNIMFLVENANKTVWHMRRKRCYFKWNDTTVSPDIIHWKVGGTETFTYEKYDAKLRRMYFKKSHLQVCNEIILSFGKYYIYPKLLKYFPGVKGFVKKHKKT